MREVIARIGGEAGVNALYWRGGVCVYEATTRGRALIEQEMSGGWQGRIRLQTQGGQAGVLLQRLVQRIEEAQARIGLRPADVKYVSAQHRVEHIEPMPVSEAAGAKAEAKLAFRQPPVAGPEWLVSYAWGDATPEGRAREAVVDELCAEAERRGIRILRDRTTLGLGDRISAFMKRIGRGDRVFAVLSDKYLKSPYCMFELCEVWRTSRAEGEEFLRRVRVYSLPDAQVWTPLDRARCAAFWKRQHDELEAFVKEHGAEVLGELDFKRFKLMGEFYRHVADILATMADIVQPHSFDDLKKALVGIRGDGSRAG
jgi:internalin A